MLKHIKLMWPYTILSLKKWHEYKFNVFTNTLGYITMLVMWVVFWNVLLSNVKVIGDWTYPMTIMLTGFVLISETLWQMVYMSLGLYKEIPKGNLDVYLVRPVNPIFAMIMRDFQMFSLLPCLIGFCVVVFALFKYFSPSLLKLFFALIICFCGAATLTLAYILIGCFSFWLGRADSVRIFYRTFLFVKTYPVTIFPYSISFFLTFVIPISLFGTIPVLVLTKFSVPLGVFSVFVALFITLFWFLVVCYFWKKGLRRYESQGG